MVRSFCFKRRYLTGGRYPSAIREYGEVIRILSILLHVSILVLVVITGADIVKVSEYAEDDVEGDLVYAVQVITVMFTIVQLVSVCLLVLYTSVPSFTRNDTYVLSLAVSEAEGKQVTMYGSTAGTGSTIDTDDVCIFYHRVTGGNCPSSCEPLSIPLQGFILPIQVICFLFSCLLVTLHSALTDINKSYASILVISILNCIQQATLLLLIYLISTDTGFCCVGFAVTRWFIHTDYYTETLQKLVKQSFKNPERNVVHEEWYRSNLVESDSDNLSNRAGQVKFLQQLLEKWHDQLYREVFVGNETAVSLFITKSEKDYLNQFYIARELTLDEDENVIFQRK